MASKDLGQGVSIVLTLSVLIVIGVIGIFLADTTVTETALQTTNVTATGTLTFTNNINDANTTTIQSVVFEFDAANDSVAAGNVNVNTTGNYTADAATAALTTAINNNATVNASVTATNPTNLTVLLTAVTTGTAGNAITTTENIANASWGGATLSGGLDASDFATMQSNFLGAGETGSGFIVVLIIAFIGAIAVGWLVDIMGKRS